MRKSMFFIIIATLLFSLVACGNTAEDKTTVYEGNTVKIEREGAITRIYDLEGGGEYSFKAVRARKKKGKADIVNTTNILTTTKTINISTVHGIIIVTTADGETLYIK